ncbi:MAG: hypothetical protein GKR88_01370 [Flavobacteriaceae bacterium]|nr:MAG: hypothetical protein GKR88_01370 [Flavobacteriaceae bacterium]
MTDSTSVSINQTIGFYPDPDNIPSISSPSTGGRFYDNEQHYYDVSVSSELDSIQFSSVINGLRNFSNSLYNLNSLNCTDIGIQSALNGGITLPDTTGSWGNFLLGQGAGSNPGDLGEDIRDMANPLSPNHNPSLTIKTTPGIGPAFRLANRNNYLK